jgi:hypothetical protein
VLLLLLLLLLQVTPGGLKVRVMSYNLLADELVSGLRTYLPDGWSACVHSVCMSARVHVAACMPALLLVVGCHL